MYGNRSSCAGMTRRSIVTTCLCVADNYCTAPRTRVTNRSPVRMTRDWHRRGDALTTYWAGGSTRCRRRERQQYVPTARCIWFGRRVCRVRAVYEERGLHAHGQPHHCRPVWRMRALRAQHHTGLFWFTHAILAMMLLRWRHTTPYLQHTVHCAPHLLPGCLGTATFFSSVKERTLYCLGATAGTNVAWCCTHAVATTAMLATR